MIATPSTTSSAKAPARAGHEAWLRWLPHAATRVGGEPPVETAARELREEAGLAAQQARFGVERDQIAGLRSQLDQERLQAKQDAQQSREALAADRQETRREREERRAAQARATAIEEARREAKRKVLGQPEPQTKTLGRGTVRVAVEAAIKQGWERFIGEDGAFVGMTGFGASAPAERLYQEFGITAENVAAQTRALLGRNS